MNVTVRVSEAKKLGRKQSSGKARDRVQSSGEARD